MYLISFVVKIIRLIYPNFVGSNVGVGSDIYILQIMQPFQAPKIFISNLKVNIYYQSYTVKKFNI